MAHNKIKNVMTELLIFCLKGGEKQFITLTKSGTTWTGNRDL